MSVPTFVVGTGRCGSTMLSNMLRQHPKVLSLSEFFAIVMDGGLRITETFSREPLNGAEFWEVVAYRGLFTSFAIRQRLPCPEWLYPCEARETRFSVETGVPGLLLTTLPHLTDDFDDLFAIMENEVPTWPTAPIAAQYTRLFGWLARHFGKTLWVERSGAGMAMLDPLLATFPDARFVHIVRDGRDAALSIREHALLRLSFFTAALEQEIGAQWPRGQDSFLIAQVQSELAPFVGGSFDAEAFNAFRLPLEICASFWAQQIVGGLPLLGSLPADRLLTLRYEDFFEDAKGQLDAIATFLGDEFSDDEWSTRCAATMRTPRSSWRDLAHSEALALTEACRPGFEALAAVTVQYEV